MEDVSVNYQSQAEELSVLQSIYSNEIRGCFVAGDEDPLVLSITIPFVDTSFHVIVSIRVSRWYPSHELPRLTFTIPIGWGSNPAAFSITSSINDLISTLKLTTSCGVPIIYEWIEKIRELCLNLPPPILPLECKSYLQPNNIDGMNDTVINDSLKTESIEEHPLIFSDDSVVDRKSVFQAHLVNVSSVDDVRRALSTLLANKKISTATHNMYAYRFRRISGNGESIIESDCNDDGETAAGGRMLHLLEIVGAEQVLVVVSRWFGGINLGADRFKHINNACRNILDKHGFIVTKENRFSKNKR